MPFGSIYVFDDGIFSISADSRVDPVIGRLRYSRTAKGVTAVLEEIRTEAEVDPVTAEFLPHLEEWGAEWLPRDAADIDYTGYGAIIINQVIAGTAPKEGYIEIEHTLTLEFAQPHHVLLVPKRFPSGVTPAGVCAWAEGKPHAAIFFSRPQGIRLLSEWGLADRARVNPAKEKIRELFPERSSQEPVRFGGRAAAFLIRTVYQQKDVRVL